MPKISIVLPTYNVEKYISRALNSCINQTFSDIEIIVVDDCGNDKSIEIAKEFANHDERIKIIKNPQNLKPLHARANGVKYSNADYIMFLDPDDELELNACEVAYNGLSQEYDLIRFGFKLIDFPKHQPQELNIAKNYYECIECIKKLEYFDFSMWSTLFKKELYLKAYEFMQYHQVKKIHNQEDDIFYFIVINITNNFKYIPAELYKYYYIPTSLTKTDTLEKLELEIGLFEKTIKFFETLLNKFPDIFNKEITNSYVYHFNNFIYTRKRKILSKEKKGFVNFLKRKKLKKEIALKFRNAILDKKEFYKYWKYKYLQTGEKKYLKNIKKINIKYYFKAILINLKQILKNHKHSIKFYFFLNKKIQHIVKNNIGDSLVVIPSDSLKEIENVGFTNIEQYYNPNKTFQNVFLLSPNEKQSFFKYGMYVFGVNSYTYKLALKIIKPKIVRAYGGYWASAFAVKNKIECIPVVCSVHDKRGSFIYNEIVDADYIFYTSKAVLESLIAKDVEIKKTYYLPDRIILDDFYKITDETLKPNYFQKNFCYILTIARLSEEKNLNTIIKALQFLPKNYKWIHIGGGDWRPYLNLAKQIGVDDKIIHINSVKNNELKYYYSFANCFCLLSKSEGFGIVYMEAAACECKIISSNISPINNHFKNNENIILIDKFYDDKEIAKTIKMVCEDLKSDIGTEAKKVALEFSTEKVNKMESNYYKQIINRMI